MMWPFPMCFMSSWTPVDLHMAKVLVTDTLPTLVTSHSECLSTGQAWPASLHPQWAFHNSPRVCVNWWMLETCLRAPHPHSTSVPISPRYWLDFPQPQGHLARQVDLRLSFLLQGRWVDGWEAWAKCLQFPSWNSGTLVSWMGPIFKCGLRFIISVQNDQEMKIGSGKPKTYLKLTSHRSQ